MSVRPPSAPATGSPGAGGTDSWEEVEAWRDPRGPHPKVPGHSSRLPTYPPAPVSQARRRC